MTQARPNAVSLAVAIAIYSSIIGTQALADRRLQTKSFDIPGNEGVEFTQTEVVVQPTLGDDQQPIPKSFTTTYPDQTEARAVYDVPSEGFTDVLSGIDGGVSSVDLFETGKNDVAQKYTKVLRVGNEGVFRFTHNLAEKQLVIEVRDGMTCQNSIRAVRIQSVNTRLLEPLTKVASPKQLARILKGANGRAGSLGAADKYTALATIKIDEVEVAGRTFMRLVASGDQPPEPQRLGKSLFINDEALLAAATSAYTQVYVLGKSLQQEALNELLAYQKPVGYVVHVEDETLAYYVPDGYPRLEVVQAPGEEIEEIIVFHGQKQNPTDIAFVKGLFNLRAEVVGNAPAPAVTAQVKKDKLKSYQHIIRSRQMALLEELATDFAVQFDAEFEEGKLLALARYEALQQALTSATPDNEDEFEFTAAHIKVASSIMTAIWLQIQLEKHFNFKPVLRDLLASEAFVQSVQRVIPVVAELPANGFGDDVKLATKVFGDMTRQLLELENQQEGLNARAGELAQLKNFLQHATERANAIEAEKQRAQSLRKQIEEELEMLLQEWKDTKKWRDKLQQEADRIPELEQQASDARVKATKIRNAQLAAELGIDDWDDFQPPEVQERLITERINEINRAVASTVAIAGEFEEKAVKAKLAAIEGHLDIIPGNEDDLDARFESIHHHLQRQAGQNIELAAQRLAIVADLLGLVPDNKNDLEARHQNIQHQQYLMQQVDEVDQETLQSTETYAEELTAIKARHADIAEQLNIENFDGNADIFLQQERLLRKLQTISAHQKHLLQKLQTLNVQDAEGEAILKARQNALASMLGIEMSKDWTVEYRSTLIDVACRKIRKLEKVLKDIRTPGHTRAWPEVLLKISAVEKAAGIEGLHKEQDIYVRRQAISDEMQTRIEEIAKQAEEEALQILEAMETILNLKVRVYKDDDKAARLSNIRLKLDSDDIPEDVLDQLLTALWEENRTLLDRTLLAERAMKFQRLRARLSYSVEGSKERARDQQRHWLEAIEEKLNIKTSENAFAKPRGHLLVLILADDLGVELEMDDSLHNKKDAIRAKIFDLLDEVDEAYDDEAVRRDRNNALARQLNIKDYKADATIDEQNRLIEYRLYQLDVSVRKIGEPDVSERIRAIDNELDELMAPLGPKPRYVLDRELAIAKRELEEAVDELTGAYRLLATLEGKNVKFAGNRADIQHLSDRGNKALNRDMKKVQIHLGLAADDDQTSEGRIEDIRLLLKKKSEEKRDEILENLRAKTNLNIEITSGLSLLEDSDYFITISSCTDSHGQKEALGRLPLTRKKYTQVTEFLREHDRKSIELANARLEEWDAKEKLDRQEKEIIDPGYMDQNAKPMHEDEMAWLGLVLKQKSDAVLKAEVALTDYHKAVLEATEASVGLKSDTSDTHEQRINALRNKQVQLGGDDGTGGRIGQLFRDQARLEYQIEIREVSMATRTEALRAARQAVVNDDSPFQYSPKQAEVLDAIHKFTQQHSLKKQALEASLGLAELATESDKFIQDSNFFDFDDEFAPVRLRALTGDGLAFDQASRIVEVFRNLKTTFPDLPSEPIEHQPLNVLQTIDKLKIMARNELKTGAQQYDDEIHGMGAAAIHHIEHEPGNLKSFSDYFATHSASAKKIIALLREGLISKIELEHYMKSFRGINDYQTVDEFEHFLGYKHGIKLPEFKKVVQMLSDEGIKEFMQSAFNPVTLTTTNPAGMKESVAGMKDYAAAVIANYVLDDIAFENGRRTAAFLTHVQDTLTPYANAAGLSESELIQAIHDTLMQAHAAAVEQQLNDYWAKPLASLIQAVTWYFTNYRPLLVAHTAPEAAKLSFSNMAFLYLLDLTNRGDYSHRMLTPFQHWLERYGVDPDRTGRYAYHSGIEQVSEVGGLAMPLGKAASSVILLRTVSMLFTRQYNANPRMYRSIYRLVPEIVQSMTSRQGVQIPLLHSITPQKVKTLASATAGLVLGPVATVGAYAHGLVSGYTYAQTFGFALASGLTFDFFMNDNKMLTQWLGGPLGRCLDKINRWTGMGETQDKYVKRTAIASPQHYGETDEDYANRVKANNTMYGWTRQENYLQFRERRDHSMEMFEHGWEKYFKENVPEWSFSHAESIPYFYTLGALYKRQQGDDQKVHGHDQSNAPQSGSLSATITH